MSGPWDKYAAAESGPAEAGPWTKYQETPAPKEPEPGAKGPQVYDKPAGPEQATFLARATERIQDPARWKAVLTGEGPHGAKVVQGAAPLAMPGGAAPKLAKAATWLAEGKGLGFLAGRTALSAGQGAVMSGLDGKQGESWQDKIDRVESGAKLSGGIQLAAESIPLVGKFAGAVTRKLGAAVSNVDENLIANYAKRTDKVNDLIKQSGGDVTAIADQVRTELSAGIQKTKQGLNAKISGALAKASPDRNIFVQPILDKLEAAKARLNPNFKASAIAEIDDMIASIGKEAVDGQINASSLYQIKQYLNEGAAPAYNKGGQIFTRASEAARAAKDAAAEARETLKPFASAISEADGQLSKLHAIERRLNKNLLAAGKPDAALFAAGSGSNPRNAATLRELERISGVPVSQRVMDAATAKTFANPALLPTDYTGKAVARQAGSALLGTAIGGPVGGMIGAAVASPMAVKIGVNLANVGKDLAAKVPSFARFTRKNPVAAQAVVQLIAGQIRRENAPPEAQEFIDQNPQLMRNVAPPAPEPKGGPDKWASDGLKKLGIQDRQLAGELMQSKEGKRLLIEASDLPIGSQRLQRIKDQIQKGRVK